MTFGSSHGFLRGIAAWGLWGFFEEVRVINEENVPKEGAVIMYVFLPLLPFSLK